VGVAWLLRQGAYHSGVYLPVRMPQVVGLLSGLYAGYRILRALRRRYPEDFPG
jgi:hypothetical protein